MVESVENLILTDVMWIERISVEEIMFLTHRGPNGQGVYVDGNVAIGFSL